MEPHQSDIDTSATSPKSRPAAVQESRPQSGIMLVCDTMSISCRKCENWVELSSADPRRRAEGYGFRFNADSAAQDFTCTTCGCIADDRYYMVVQDDGAREERDVTKEILSYFDRAAA